MSSLNRYFFEVKVPVIDIVYLSVSREKFKEVLVFGNFNISQIQNLSSLKPENSTYMSEDIYKENLDNWGTAGFSLPEEKWPIYQKK